MKIEIPLFHIINARISFGNIFSLNTPVDKVTPLKDETTCACIIDETVFEIPMNYSYLGRFSKLSLSASLFASKIAPNLLAQGQSDERREPASRRHKRFYDV